MNIFISKYINMFICEYINIFISLFFYLLFSITIYFDSNGSGNRHIDFMIGYSSIYSFSIVFTLRTERLLKRQ